MIDQKGILYMSGLVDTLVVSTDNGLLFVREIGLNGKIQRWLVILLFMHTFLVTR